MSVLAPRWKTRLVATIVSGLLAFLAHADTRRDSFEAGLSAYTSADYVAAYEAFLSAANDGYPPAQYNAAQMMRLGEGTETDLAAALKWYERAAEAGHALAQYSLGIMFSNGEHAPRNPARAIQWYIRAAHQGVTDAQFNVAVMFEQGDGTDPNLVDAYAWFSIAARSGDLVARNRADSLAARLSPGELERARVRTKAITSRGKAGA